jgi:hypothetical protein
MHEDHQAKILNLNLKTSNVPMFMLFWNPQLMHDVWLKSYKRLAFFSKQMAILMAPFPCVVLGTNMNLSKKSTPPMYMSIMQLFTPFSFTIVYNASHLNELLNSMHKCIILTTTKT